MCRACRCKATRSLSDRGGSLTPRNTWRCVRWACGASSVGVGLPSLESHATSMSGMEEVCPRRLLLVSPACTEAARSKPCFAWPSSCGGGQNTENKNAASQRNAMHAEFDAQSVLSLHAERNAIHLKNKTRLCVLL